MASREEFLESIKPGMRLDRAFFLKVYGYSVTCPEFADQVISRLEKAGCSRARWYYENVAGDAERKYDEGLRAAAAWYRKEIESGRSDEKRKQETVARLHRMSDVELYRSLLNMKQGGKENGL